MKLRSKKLLIPLSLINLSALIVLLGVIYFFDFTWNSFDYKLIDKVYKYAVENNAGPKIDNKIVHLFISDATYDASGSNILRRDLLAQTNNILTGLSPQSVMYDIIFARKGNPHQDSLFLESLINSDIIYLPVALQLADDSVKFRNDQNIYDTKLQSEFVKTPSLINSGKPFYAKYSLTQNDLFSEAITKTGHISSLPDGDGVYRHYPLIIKIDGGYLPTVTLSMFLEYVEIPFDSLLIEWGEKITIPKLNDSYLDKEIIIPIDERGQCFIPYPYNWQQSPKRMELHNLLMHSEDEEKFDELSEFFEGSFVFIGDISTGIADLGHTPLENDVPLVAVHSALMNAYLTDSFYSELKSEYLILFVLLVSLFTFLALIPKTNLFLYFIQVSAILFIIAFTFYQINNFTLIPVFSFLTSSLLLSFITILSIQIISTKEEKFIKSAFSKYLPTKVVDQLVDNPQLLQLGGEERQLSILFSDIANFTTISESMKVKDLVALLNDYLTRMTNIVFENYGIIDKYIGDAILAEFGAPVFLENHAQLALNTAIRMQKELNSLNSAWKEKYNHELRARIGINTGKVIIGNMGSKQMFDYTAIGDSVNLAARLEGVNKFYKTGIIISENTFNQIDGNQYIFRLLDFIKVKGKSKPVKIYEVYDFHTGNETSDKLNLFNLYDAAFNEYLNKNFAKSSELLKNITIQFPDDFPTQKLLKRIEDTLLFNSSDSIFKKVDDDWDGSIELTEK